MSRMSELYMDVERLVIDAMSEPGVMSDKDVLNYVNERSPINISLDVIEFILDKFFGDDWAGGADIPSYH